MEKLKDKFWQLVSIVLAASLIITIVKLNDISLQLDSMKNDYTTAMNSFQSIISGLYSDVEELIENKASPLTSINVDFGELNAENKTVSVTLTVIPKSFDDDTTVNMVINDTTYKAEYDGKGAYFITKEFSLFDHVDAVTVLVSTNIGTQTQVEWLDVGYLYSKTLPMVNAEFLGDVRYTFGNTAVVSGKILADIVEYDAVSIKSLKAVTEVNGEVVWSEDVTIEDSLVTFDHSKSYNVPREEVLSMYLLMEDSLGFVHKYQLMSRMWDSSNQMHIEATYEGETIYDSDGNLMHTPIQPK